MVLYGNGWCCNIYWCKDYPKCSITCRKNWKATGTGYRWHLVCFAWLFSRKLYFQDKVSKLHQWEVIFKQVVSCLVLLLWNSPIVAATNSRLDCLPRHLCWNDCLSWVLRVVFAGLLLILVVSSFSVCAITCDLIKDFEHWSYWEAN